MRLLILSGLSGAGKSVALHMLEDLGLYCVDNLPLSLLESLVEELSRHGDFSGQGVAVGIDARSHASELSEFAECLARLRRHGVQVETLFLQAEADTLLKRYSETRRRHPLSSSQTALIEAIEEERRILNPIAEQADLVLDTTRTNIHQLRDLIRQRIHGRDGFFSLMIQSFAFKNGVPADADFVFDIRCLPNPHWQPGLRPLTGLDTEVAVYLESEPLTRALFDDICGFLGRWLPRFESENRSYLTVAIGCTGGQHRSVYMAERLRAHLAQTYPHVLVRHSGLQH
ncbi:MAG TPA: RNase adapter RapZ [Candidatus Macondimonas sp.]|nr:RNase adapter RapZ [Candidatus Macondimonas sp.]